MVLILIVSFLSRIVSFSYLCLFLVMLFKLSLIGVSGQNPTSVEWLWSASKRKCSETPYLEQFKFIGSVNYHNIYYIILNYVYGRISVEDIQYFNCSEIHVDQWFNIMETTCGDLEVYRNLYKPFLNVPMNVNLDIFEDDDIEFLGYRFDKQNDDSCESSVNWSVIITVIIVVIVIVVIVVIVIVIVLLKKKKRLPVKKSSTAPPAFDQPVVYNIQFEQSTDPPIQKVMHFPITNSSIPPDMNQVVPATSTVSHSQLSTSSQFTTTPSSISHSQLSATPSTLSHSQLSTSSQFTTTPSTLSHSQVIMASPTSRHTQSTGTNQISQSSHIPTINRLSQTNPLPKMSSSKVTFVPPPPPKIIPISRSTNNPA